jgi:hypothetical protein
MKKYKCSKCGRIDKFKPLPKDKHKKRIKTICSASGKCADAYWVLQTKKLILKLKK